MKGCEEVAIEHAGQVDREMAIETQIEVDLISGGIGFDDGPTDIEWMKELREKTNLTRQKIEGK